MRSSTVRISSAITALVGVAILGFATPASAHDVLVSSTPAAGETLTELPSAFSITMNENLLDLAGDASGFAIQVQDASGGFYGDGCLTVDAATLSMGASLGDPGTYTFTWQAVSEDGHPVSDVFTFDWAGEATAPASAEPPVCGVTGVPTAEPSASPSEDASAAPSATPIAISTEVDGANPTLWIIGGIVVLAAIVVVIAMVTRRPKV